MPSFSEERLAPANGIELAYQEMGDPQAEPLLLIMGLATQMLGWDEQFCALLAERDFRVIRFDNRDIGCSTQLNQLGVSSRADIVIGRRSTAPYLLGDMAADTAGLLDHLEIESAHVVGASMGGMIAQTLAIEHPDRVRSLVSIMSTTGSRWVGSPTFKTFGLMLSDFPRNRDAYIERAVKTFKVIGSPDFPMDEERVREIAGAMHDRGHHPAGILRQMHAITASGNRTPGLRRLRLPVTVIHGSRDPLIRPSGGQATAKAIPNARLRMIEGMGHDFPEHLWPTFVEEIASIAARSGHGAQQKQAA
jgi:pimeloyl-ACP methyl ester carboxylesterase